MKCDAIEMITKKHLEKMFCQHEAVDTKTNVTPLEYLPEERKRR
jgi:hypothetical protein